MTISVLIAVYNAEETIMAAIESILIQTYQDFEIIIIDDGCTDNTISILNEIGDARIKIYTNKENLGQIKSLNRGIKYCKGEFIARMDADDISLPFRFEHQINTFKKDSSLILVGTSGYKTLPTGKVKKLLAFPRSIDALQFYSMYRNPLNHISVMIRRDFFKPPNIYNDKYIISTDWELWSRYLTSGVNMKILKKRCINYLVAESSYSKRNGDIKISENIEIVQKNVFHYTGIRLKKDEALDIISLHYFNDFHAKTFLKKLRLWNKITTKFQYQNKRHFYYAYLYDIILITLKLLRLIIINLPIKSLKSR